MTIIYLDIDGVLLTKDRKPALYVHEFLTYVLSQYPDSTYWLTTHCQGNAENVIQHIGKLFPEATVELMRRIKPTTWDVAKTEGIDFSQPFLWFDDNCFEFEKRELEKYGASDSWIQVDLEKNNRQLESFVHDFPVI